MALLTINVIWYASTWHDIVADTMIRYTLRWLIVIFHHTIRYHVIGCNMISYCILSYDMERLTLYEIIMYHMISYNEICYHIRVTTWNHWNDFIWLNIIWHKSIWFDKGWYHSIICICPYMARLESPIFCKCVFLRIVGGKPSDHEHLSSLTHLKS